MDLQKIFENNRKWIADKLALDVTPMNWPIGMGGIYEGLYDFQRNTLSRPRPRSGSSALRRCET